MPACQNTGQRSHFKGTRLCNRQAKAILTSCLHLEQLRHDGVREARQREVVVAQLEALELAARQRAQHRQKNGLIDQGIVEVERGQVWARAHEGARGCGVIRSQIQRDRCELRRRRGQHAGFRDREVLVRLQGCDARAAPQDVGDVSHLKGLADDLVELRQVLEVRKRADGKIRPVECQALETGAVRAESLCQLHRQRLGAPLAIDPCMDQFCAAQSWVIERDVELLQGGHTSAAFDDVRHVEGRIAQMQTQADEVRAASEQPRQCMRVEAGRLLCVIVRIVVVEDVEVAEPWGERMHPRSMKRTAAI